MTNRYQFDKTISRPVLENYLARSITMEGLLNGRGDLADNIRMLKSAGAKYIGRALCLWGAEADFLHNIERAKAQIPQVLAADPDMILEACVFETVSPRVNQIAVPDWVFAAFGRPVENRNFRFDEMIYPDGQRRPMGRSAQVPDVSRLETRLWFYYQAATYIEIGCQAIHFGQVEIMNKNDPENAHWEQLLNLVRAYAAQHARHHMVLCNGHVPSGGLLRHGRPLLDFHAFPLRVMEVADKPQEAILKVGFSDGIYGRSQGGLTFSGWACEHLPYLVELDNWGVSRQPGQAKAGGIWVWGYDEITWFAHQSKAYRRDWLRYAWDWVRQTDTNGFLEMPGSRTESSPLDHQRWYYANLASPAVPDGLGDEEAIRAIWADDSASHAAISAPATLQNQTNLTLSRGQQIEKCRADCIERRRTICGKILKVLPDGLVVESGYTNLMRPPLNHSWLVPGSAEARLAANLVEGEQPDCVCVGLVFLTDPPKKPVTKVFDYVVLTGYPTGPYTYTSVGDLQRTVRRFSAKLSKAVQWHLDENKRVGNGHGP